MMKIKLIKLEYAIVIDVTIQPKIKFKLQKKNYVTALTNAQATISFKNIKKI